MDPVQYASENKRCAIYTRKSAQPPLGQEVTSVQAQRAICSAYIASQQHKGWREIPTLYEDEGRSGSNLDRPGLQQLLDDIELGHVDVVLIYKLDRITRTLLDFVRLIDLFERYGVVFVAITQNFDTSDSMGRLIRNVLLTFAQFEREIASDRISDKKSVMKQRGLWTGGDAPIGYDLRRGKLVMNQQEAEAVQLIFETYAVEKRLAAVHRRLQTVGFRRKTWRCKNGTVKGGKPIALSTLHHVLSNPAYVGEVTHRGKRYPGVHEPIISRQLWLKVEAALNERRTFKPQLAENLLTGILFDAYGRRMHARAGRNNHNRFRYYQSAVVRWATRQAMKPVRARAEGLEKLVMEALKALLVDRAELRIVLMKAGIFAPELDRLGAAGNEAAVRLGRQSPRQLSCLLKSILQRVEIHSELVRLMIRLDALPHLLAWDGVGFFVVSAPELCRAKAVHIIDVAAHLNRERRGRWIPVQARKAKWGPVDPKLTSLLDDAREAQRLIFENRDVAFADLAWSIGRKPLSFGKLVRLNYLAPDIVAAILDGAQPQSLTRKILIETDLPTDWIMQRRLLGFDPVCP